MALLKNTYDTPSSNAFGLNAGQIVITNRTWGFNQQPNSSFNTVKETKGVEETNTNKIYLNTSLKVPLKIR